MALCAEGELTLMVDKEEDGEIVEGNLHCAACDETYPIEDSIPTSAPQTPNSQHRKLRKGLLTGEGWGEGGPSEARNPPFD